MLTVHKIVTHSCCCELWWVCNATQTMVFSGGVFTIFFFPFLTSLGFMYNFLLIYALIVRVLFLYRLSYVLLLPFLPCFLPRNLFSSSDCLNFLQFYFLLREFYSVLSLPYLSLFPIFFTYVSNWKYHKACQFLIGITMKCCVSLKMPS